MSLIVEKRKQKVLLLFSFEMSKAVKASTVRARHAATIKQTITTCTSTLIVYKEELETAWSGYNSAFTEHEDSIIGKDQDELNAITTEFATIHTA